MAALIGSDPAASGSKSQFLPPLSFDKVKEAASALVECLKKKGSNDLLLGDDGVKIGLQLGFKRAPKTKKTCIKISLPHGLATPSTDVCLFVKDLDKSKREYNETVVFFKDLLAEKGVKTVTDIIPIKSLRTEYKQYEAKINLSNMYDIYLADARIVGILPKMLGKHFYGRRTRLPIQVNLLKKDLSAEIDEAINNTRMHLTGRGTSSMAAIAHSEMTVDQIAENAFAAASCIAEKIPGGSDNVQQLFLTSPGIPSLPIYLSTAPGDDIILPSNKKVVVDEKPEEVTTVVGAKVKINRRYDVIVIPDEKEPTEKAGGQGRKRKSDRDKSEPANKKTKKGVAKLSKGKSKYTLVKQPKKAGKSSS